MPQLPFHSHNALSNSPSGESYIGLGCFPLGHHLTHTDVSDLVSTLHHLRLHKMLHLVSTEARQELEAHLAPLREEQNHWPRQPRNTPEAHAVQELLDDIDIRSERLQVYTFPDSTRLSSTAPQAWGIFELDTHTRTTYLYISTKSHDFTGTVLHTYMSSRRCTRMQCFLAEYELADLANSLSKEWGLPDRFQKDIDALCTENLAELLERLEQEPISDAPVLMAKLKVYCEEVLERKKEPGWWVEDEEQ